MKKIIMIALFFAACGGEQSLGRSRSDGAEDAATVATDASGDAGENHCDPAVLCYVGDLRRCSGVMYCGSGQTIDCSMYIHCASNEFCPEPLPPNPDFCRPLTDR